MAAALSGVLCFRSARAEGPRGGAARRARRDAGRSRAAVRHERLSGGSPDARVRGEGLTRRPGNGERATDLCCPPNSRRVSYFAVFDGHGGARASQFAAENLHQILAKKFPIGKLEGWRRRVEEWRTRRAELCVGVSGEMDNVDKPIRKCLLDTFRQTDEDFLKKASSQ